LGLTIWQESTPYLSKQESRTKQDPRRKDMTNSPHLWKEPVTFQGGGANVA